MPPFNGIHDVGRGTEQDAYLFADALLANAAFREVLVNGAPESTVLDVAGGARRGKNVLDARRGVAVTASCSPLVACRGGIVARRGQPMSQAATASSRATSRGRA